MTKKFNKYLFHCSQLPQLMTKSRDKSSVLSETAKTLLREIWIKEMFGREKYDSYNKYTKKGLLVESDSMEMVHEATGDLYFKNEQMIANDYICGTPDAYNKYRVIDIKSSWDIWTFAAVDEDKARKDYYHQLMGYMWLTERVEGRLIYVLSNTPEELIQDELYRLSFNLGEDKANECRKNYIYDDLDPKLRVKQFHFETYTNEDVDSFKAILTEARKYLNKMEL